MHPAPRLAGLVVADQVGAARRLEVRGDAERRAIGDLDRRARQVQGDDRRAVARPAASSTGTSLCSQGCRSHDLAVGEQLGHARLEDAEVRAAVVGGLGPRVAGHPDHLADLDLRVLRQLAEQAHGPVLQVGEASRRWSRRRRSRRHSSKGRSAKFTRGDPDGDPGVRELGDLLRQERPSGFCSRSYQP